MKHPKILVTGATGRTGRAVVDELLAKDVPVRAVVRSRDARSAALERKGAETVIADMFDPQQVESAVRGVQRIAYVPPWHPHVLNSGVLFATAAQRAGVEAIVGVTQWLANPSHPAISTRQMWLLDRLFDRVPGVAHVTVNPGFFASGYLLPLPIATLFGIFPGPTGGGRNAPASNEDIAGVMVGALLDPARHAGRTYHPTGPEMLSGDDMARIIPRISPQCLLFGTGEQCSLDQQHHAQRYLRAHEQAAQSGTVAEYAGLTFKRGRQLDSHGFERWRESR